MQFASEQFPYKNFLPTMNYANQSKVLTSYSTVKMWSKANRRSWRAGRTNLCECVLCLNSVLFDMKTICSIVNLVCVSVSAPLFIANGASFDDYGHTSFVAHSNIHDTYQCAVYSFTISTSICVQPTTMTQTKSI